MRTSHAQLHSALDNVIVLSTFPVSPSLFPPLLPVTQGRAVVAPSTAMAGSVAPLAGHPRVMRKQLPPETFSHIEDRDECLQLEYTPYFVEAPVDLRYPSRCTRMGRQVRDRSVCT